MTIHKVGASPPRARRIADLPGPAGLPLLGNLLQITREELHRQLETWAAEHGTPYRFRIGPREYAVMSDPQAVAAILHDRPDGFQRTDRLSEAAGEVGFDGVFSASGDAWKRQRPMVQAALDPAHGEHYFPTLHRVGMRLAARWQRAAEADQMIDLQADLMRYAVDVTAGLAFGADVNTVEMEHDPLQAHLDHVFPELFKRLMSPWPHWRFRGIAPAPDPKIHLHLGALRLAVDDFIAAAGDRLAREPRRREQPTDFVEALIAARDRAADTLTDQEVRGNMLTMLLAGRETTANTLAWMIWLLHETPEAAARLRAEVRGVLGHAAIPTHHEQLEQFHYLGACIRETMRLRPVVPINMQQAVRDTVVDGVEIPAGAIALCLTRPAGLDAAHFVDPTAFRPERWLNGEVDGRASGRVMSFGAGPRRCPGSNLAVAQMRMAAALLYASFDTVVVAVEGGGAVRERLALTMSPVGLRMRLRARDAHAAVPR